jgi:hypothetical protein
MRHWWPKTLATIAILLLVWAVGHEARAQKRPSFGTSGGARSFGSSRTGGSPNAAATPSTSSASGTSFKAFEILNQRNIFDPTRVPFRPQIGPRPTPKPRPDSISFVGVFMSDETHLAIFDSSLPGVGGKSYSSGDVVGGLKLLSFDTEHAQLQDGNRTLDLPVGSALSRRPNEEWRLAGAGGTLTVASEDETPGDSADVTSGTAVAPPPAPAGMSDMVKKMMERRQKESGQKETKQ